jgi:hypothetical protein
MRVELSRYSFSTGNVAGETSLFRIIHRCVFLLVIAAHPVGIHIIRHGQGYDKLTGITIIQFAQAVPAKCHSIDRCGFSKIYFDPAIPAITDPA